MNATSSRQALSEVRHSLSSKRPRSVLDREAIANGAATRRMHISDIEADMDMACEQAVVGHRAVRTKANRDTWDGQAWDRYVDEAVRQARLRGDELESLRREAGQLERLLQAR